MTQLDTPYPATAYLMGFLRQHAAALDLELAQADASIGMDVDHVKVRAETRSCTRLSCRLRPAQPAVPPWGGMTSTAAGV